MKERLRGFDPFRTAMLTTPDGRMAAILLAVLCAGFFAVARVLCGAMEGATVIALCGTLCVAMLLLAACRPIRGAGCPVVVLLLAALLAMLAVGAHLAMLDIKPGRYTKVLAPLLEELWNYDLTTAMAWEDGAWSGGYLIVCALLSRLEGFPALYAFKLFDLVCQCAAACAALRLAQRGGAGPVRALAGMFACVLAPTILLNVGCWAQCDAMFAALTLWGLALTLERRPMAGCLLLGVGLATKLQSAFILPILLVPLLEGRVSLRHLLAATVSFIAVHVPMLLDGQGLAAVFGRYAAQIELASESIGLADNAPGVYGLMSIASVREFSGMGLYFGIACALLVVLALLRAKRPLSERALLLGAWLLAAGLPLILPQMNARCLYLAGMLGFALARSREELAAALTLEAVSLCCYMQAIFGAEVLPMTALSLLAIAAAVVIALSLLRELGGAQKHEEPAQAEAAR